MITKIIHSLFLSCKKATLFIELNNGNNLNVLQKIRLKTHLKICKYCKSYEEKAQRIDRVLNNELHSVNIKNTNELEEKIKKRILGSE